MFFGILCFDHHQFLFLGVRRGLIRERNTFACHEQQNRNKSIPLITWKVPKNSHLNIVMRLVPYTIRFL